jgi:hypothetical protein
MLTLGSLFDGIGGWQLAAIRAGVKPVWSSEIEATGNGMAQSVADWIINNIREVTT